MSGSRIILPPDEIPDQSESVRFVKDAAHTVSGHRVVAPRQDGKVEYADNLNILDITRPLWFTLEAAVEDDPVRCLALGSVYEPGWTWQTGTELFLGINGNIVTTAPTDQNSAFLMRIGYVIDTTSIFFDPQVVISFTPHFGGYMGAYLGGYFGDPSGSYEGGYKGGYFGNIEGAYQDGYVAGYLGEPTGGYQDGYANGY